MGTVVLLHMCGKVYLPGQAKERTSHWWAWRRANWILGALTAPHSLYSQVAAPACKRAVGVSMRCAVSFGGTAKRGVPVFPYVHIADSGLGSGMSISASEARRRLFSLLEQVNTDHEPVRITSRGGDAVLMSAADYDSWQATVYLFRSPENARSLMEAVARDKAERSTPVSRTLDELREEMDAVPMSVLLAADSGQDIDFEPERLGLTDRAPDL